MTGIDIKPDAQGKVRDLYDLGDKLLLVATDRISAFDYILEDEIPHKGAVLTQLSCFWFELLDGVVENHLISSDVADLPEQFQPYADYLRGRVLYTQEKTFRQLLKAQEESVRAHEAVRLANAVPAEQRAANYDSLMAEAREMVRKGQLYWDYVSAENSVGFHNPAKALDTLMSSMEFSHKAVALAEQATGYSISPALAGDIKQIVPPILNMSRKLQQDADFLKQHPWTQLLPVLPKAEQVWNGQELSAR